MAGLFSLNNMIKQAQSVPQGGRGLFPKKKNAVVHAIEDYEAKNPNDEFDSETVDESQRMNIDDDAAPQKLAGGGGGGRPTRGLFSGAPERGKPFSKGNALTTILQLALPTIAGAANGQGALTGLMTGLSGAGQGLEDKYQTDLKKYGAEQTAQANADYRNSMMELNRDRLNADRDYRDRSLDIKANPPPKAVKPTDLQSYGKAKAKLKADFDSGRPVDREALAIVDAYEAKNGVAP